MGERDERSSDLHEQRREDTKVENEVTALGAIARDITESPHGLLLNVLVAGAKEFDEDGQSAGVDDTSRLQRVARGDIGERPGGLELQLIVVSLQKFNELGHNAGTDDLVDGRIGLFGEELAEALGHIELLLVVAMEKRFHHLARDHLIARRVEVLHIGAAVRVLVRRQVHVSLLQQLLLALLLAQDDAVVLASLAQLLGVQVRVLVLAPHVFITFSLRHCGGFQLSSFFLYCFDVLYR